MKTGFCKFIERCKFHHPVNWSAPDCIVKWKERENCHGMDYRPRGVFLASAEEQEDAKQGQPKLHNGVSSGAKERSDESSDMVGFGKVNKVTRRAWQDSETWSWERSTSLEG